MYLKNVFQTSINLLLRPTLLRLALRQLSNEEGQAYQARCRLESFASYEEIVMIHDNPDSVSRCFWFAIQTRSQHENVVRYQLLGLVIEQLLPAVLRVNQWKDRKKEI